jgi:hypothetical protein
MGQLGQSGEVGDALYFYAPFIPSCFGLPWSKSGMHYVSMRHLFLLLHPPSACQAVKQHSRFALPKWLPYGKLLILYKEFEPVITLSRFIPLAREAAICILQLAASTKFGLQIP